MKSQLYFMSAIWIFSYAFQVSFDIFILHWERKLTNLFCVFQEICCLESLSASFLDIQPTFNDKFHILQAFYCLKNSPIQYTIYLVCWYSYLRLGSKIFRSYYTSKGKRLSFYIFGEADFDKRPVWFQLYIPHRELIVLLCWLPWQLPAQFKKSISLAKIIISLVVTAFHWEFVIQSKSLMIRDNFQSLILREILDNNISC